MLEKIDTNWWEFCIQYSLLVTFVREIVCTKIVLHKKFNRNNQRYRSKCGCEFHEKNIRFMDFVRKTSLSSPLALSISCDQNHKITRQYKESTWNGSCVGDQNISAHSMSSEIQKYYPKITFLIYFQQFCLTRKQMLMHFLLLYDLIAPLYDMRMRQTKFILRRYISYIFFHAFYTLSNKERLANIIIVLTSNQWANFTSCVFLQATSHSRKIFIFWECSKFQIAL